MSEIRKYVVIAWSRNESREVSFRFDAYDASDAKTQAEIFFSKFSTYDNEGKRVPVYSLTSIEPWKEVDNGI